MGWEWRVGCFGLFGGGDGGWGGGFAFGGDFGGHEDGGFHAAGVGFVFAGDVEGGAVVGGGADDGEAEGDVDAAVEVEEFDGDEALVVVHGDDEVVVALDGFDEDGVGGEGAVGVDAVLAGHEDGGLDDAFFLVAELAVFAGVGVEAADGDAGFFDAEPIDEGGVGEVDGVEDGADFEGVAEVEEGFVDGGEDDAEAVVGA